MSPGLFRKTSPNIKKDNKNITIYSIPCHPACFAALRPISKMIPKPFYLQHSVSPSPFRKTSPNIENNTKSITSCSIPCPPACFATLRPRSKMIPKQIYLQHFVSIGLLCNTLPNISNNTKSILFTACRVNRFAFQRVAQY